MMHDINGAKEAYKKAGVDIDAGNQLVEDIKPAIKKTMRPGVMGSVGGFGALFDLKEAGYHDPILVSATDGVGTKLKIAIETGRHDGIGQDLVAMCVNDLVVQGAEPLFFLDYFASGSLAQVDAKSIIEGVAKGCALAGCALIGGETAEMPGLYKGGDYDLAGFAVGAVERGRMITGETLKDGDVLIGLPSNGLHSNGYSLVRKILKDNDIGFEDKLPFEDEYGAQSFADILLRPTCIYSASLSAVIKEAPGKIKSMAHITGGGLLENIPRTMPEGLSAKIDTGKWKYLNIFKFLSAKANIQHEEMAVTFNCGLGMVIGCAAEDAEGLCALFKAKDQEAHIIGTVSAENIGAPVVLSGDGWA